MDYCKTCKHQFNRKYCTHCEQKVYEGVEVSKPTLYEEFNKDEHCKGYIFDSLVYRYKFALEQGLEARIRGHMNKGASRLDAEIKAREMMQRDLLRFCQILDEAIGEHD